jgi:hypothetical protein
LVAQRLLLIASKLLDPQSAYTENCSTREKEAKIGSQEDWQMIDKELAGTTGLEPATSDVTGRRSNQLNYVPACLCRIYGWYHARKIRRNFSAFTNTYGRI